MAKRMLTTADAARRLGVGPERVRQLERSGTLRAAVRTERGWRLFLLADVEKLAARRLAARGESA